MTARAKGLGALTLTYMLWVDEYEKPNHIMSEAQMSADGNHIVYQAEIFTPYRTLTSKRHGWLTEDDITALKTMYSQLDTNFVLIFDDETTESVRFAHEKPLVFTPLFEGSDYYTAVIPLAKV